MSSSLTNNSPQSEQTDNAENDNGGITTPPMTRGRATAKIRDAHQAGRESHTKETTTIHVKETLTHNSGNSDRPHTSSLIKADQQQQVADTVINMTRGGGTGAEVEVTSSFSSPASRTVPAVCATPTMTTTKSLDSEFVSLKQSVHKVIATMERFEKLFLADKNVTTIAGTTADNSTHIKRESGAEENGPENQVQGQGTSNAPRHRGTFLRNNRGNARGGRRFFPRAPFRTRNPLNLKVLEPVGLEPIDCLGQLELKGATLRCLEHYGVTGNGDLEKNVLKPLIEGSDTIMQVRGQRLDEYAIYAVIDMLDGASIEGQVVILLTQRDKLSTKTFVSSLQKMIEITEVPVDVFPIQRMNDIWNHPSAKLAPARPSIVICAPELYPRLIQESFIRIKDVRILMVYEAEFVMRGSKIEEYITKPLHDLQECQVILACRVGTEEVAKAAEMLDFDDHRVIFSQDYVNLKSARHLYFKDDAVLLEGLLKRTVELSKEFLVVVVCHDQGETNRIREKVEKETEVLTIAKVAENAGLISGLLVTPQTVSSILHGRPHTATRLILNLSGQSLVPLMYFELLASYMDVGQPCTVISSIRAGQVLSHLEPLDLLEITTSSEHTL
ncbi:hypothetical protein BGZ83_006719 [Gryganskiella cystojenkinii]|nr:hypothetical protein BGZ83_006719 [Gryganskiella cystojenkinii]